MHPNSLFCRYLNMICPSLPSWLCRFDSDRPLFDPNGQHSHQLSNVRSVRRLRWFNRVWHKEWGAILRDQSMLLQTLIYRENVDTLIPGTQKQMVYIQIERSHSDNSISRKNYGKAGIDVEGSVIAAVVSAGVHSIRRRGRQADYAGGQVYYSCPDFAILLVCCLQ